MKPRHFLAVATAVVAAAVSASSTSAQQPGNSRAVEPEPDLFKPYAAQSASAAKPAAYSRTPPRAKAPLPPLPPPNRSYAAAVNRGVGNYYPAMRRGNGPNSNVVDPHTLCVPGRRAAILRGRQ
jgi:hypothetical protein